MRLKNLHFAWDISIHAPTRGATFAQGRLHISFDEYFNSHPYARGDAKKMCDILGIDDISIHAPTRGATMRLCPLNGRDGFISIHAPTRGATGLSSVLSTV